MRRLAGTIAACGAALLSLAWQSAPVGQTPAPIPLKLLYDTLVDVSIVADALKTEAEPVLIVYQYTSPDSATTGEIDVPKVLSAIAKMTAGEQPEWGMLDFEYKFTDRLQKGADDPQAQFATAQMLKLLRSVKASFPATKWTFYGVPFVPYWMQNKSWDDADESIRRSTLTEAGKAYAPIAAECDWVSPSIYPVYDPADYPEAQRADVRRAGVAWRRVQVALARLIARGKPVIPMVSPVWQPNGKAPAGTPVPPVQFIEDQVVPAMRAGAMGVAIWTSYDRIIQAACKQSIDPAKPEEFPRALLARAFLGDRQPEDWSAPQVAVRLREQAAKVVLRALRDVRAWQIGRVPEASAPPF